MIHDQLARRAELTPDRHAVYFDGRWYSYAQLDQRARRLAGALAARDITAGDRVGILALNHLAHFDLLHAAPKLGCIYTPFNYRLSAAEHQALCAELSPSLLLHDSGHAALAASSNCPLQDLAEYEDWLNAAPTLTGSAAVADGDIAMILCTGGSTGAPKGVMIPYRQQFYNAVNTVFGWGLRDSDCVIQTTPAFHAALNAMATPLLQLGGRVVLQASFDPGEYLQLARDHGASLMFMVPTMFQVLAEHPDFATSDLSSVRWAISGGAPCPAPVREAYRKRGVHFMQGFGMTEAGVNCFAIDLADAQARPESVGRPMPHTIAAIRDPQGAPVALGEVGELTLAGPHLCQGYWNQPAATAETIRDGWLWTGDLARQDEDGFYYIVGRRKDMFISGGENVFPAEVENALYALPQVAECAVLGIPDARWGEIGLAAVVPRDGATLSGTTLREALRPHLAGYKLPREYLFLDALPRSGAGKILKPELRRQWAARQETVE